MSASIRQLRWHRAELYLVSATFPENPEDRDWLSQRLIGDYWVSLTGPYGEEIKVVRCQVIAADPKTGQVPPPWNTHDVNEAKSQMFDRAACLLNLT